MLTEKELKYINDSEEELKQLLKMLSIIPAPSNHEEKRAEFVKKWINENSFEVFSDEADNVIWPVNVTENCDLFVVSAHTDVVFSDEKNLPFHEDSEKYYCPGIGDDTARLAILLIAARYFARHFTEYSDQNATNAANAVNAANAANATNAANAVNTANAANAANTANAANAANVANTVNAANTANATNEANADRKPVDFSDKKSAQPKKRHTGFLIVANTGEEGLGNLRGTRCILDTYKDRIREFITIDGNPDALITRAVGSHRYRISVKTKGGHSFNDYGNDNAIEKLSEIIEALYRIRIPEKQNAKTTLNVGNISGGTSVNTIAEEANMLFEYRSDDAECLEYMKTSFENVLDSFKNDGLDISCEVMGIRPCGAAENENAFQMLKQMVIETEKEEINVVPRETSGSTDANYPLSLGIPAVCIGAGIAGKTHTREEYVYKDSLKDGCRFVLALLKKAYMKY